MKTPQKFLISASTAALAAMLAYSGFAAAAGPPPPPRGPAPPSQGPPPPPRTGNPPPTTTPPPTSPVSTAPVAPVILPPTLANGTFVDTTGETTSINDSSDAVPANLFFHPLGTNGRACASCHSPNEGWSITPAGIQTLFNQTSGTAPLFSTVDGSNSPNAPVATLAERQAAYSELLSKGLIRIGLPIPSGAQFTLSAVDDPYKFASAAQLSLFRRPLPTTNLVFLSTVMFDGRETIPNDSIEQDLAAQAANAVATHEQGTAVPSQNELQSIVAFETANFTAQTFDNSAGLLTADGATGGPIALSGDTFTPGSNLPSSGTFNPDVFTMFESWASPASTTPAQQSLARGEQIFDSRPFTISNVPGFNDVIGRPSVMGTCTTCHNTPDAGDHSLAVYIDLGLTDPGRITPDLPQYTLRNSETGAVRVTSDPGRALVTGQWTDIGKFKVPTLRGLADRAPYFHNGFATDTNHVVGFYNQRFNIGLTPQQQTDLANFLNTL